MSNSIVLARKTFQVQSANLLPSSNGMAMCLLLLDRSGSMDQHGDTPRLAVNELIETLRIAPGAEQTLFALITFAGDVTLDTPPVRADQAQLLMSYTAQGNTALYQAAYNALMIGLEFRGFAQTRFSADARIAISLISDGADTASRNKVGEVRKLSETARGYGFALQAIGLGIDAQKLALDLGFEPGLAHDAPATSDGLRGSMDSSIGTFIGTMTGQERPRR